MWANYCLGVICSPLSLIIRLAELEETRYEYDLFMQINFVHLGALFENVSTVKWVVQRKTCLGSCMGQWTDGRENAVSQAILKITMRIAACVSCEFRTKAILNLKKRKKTTFELFSINIMHPQPVNNPHWYDKSQFPSSFAFSFRKCVLQGSLEFPAP